MTLRHLLLLALMFVSASAAEGSPITLSDLNSTFSVDPASQAGAFSWEVDGTNQLFKEWFWYRSGFMSRERSIEQLANGSAASYVATASDNDADSDLDKLVITYQHPDQVFTAVVEYDLSGSASGSGASTVSEKIQITNNRPPGGTNLVINLFEYSNFTVNGNDGDDTATKTSPSTITQTDQEGGSATVTSIQPVPNHYEIAPVPITLNKLNDSSPTTLSDTGSPTGPTDVAFAFQWTQIILPGSTFAITKDKQIAGAVTAIPEPESLALLASGLLCVGWWRRRSGKPNRARHVESCY